MGNVAACGSRARGSAGTDGAGAAVVAESGQCRLDRVPAPLLSCVYTHLTVDEHARLSAASRHLRRVALLPSSSCIYIRFIWFPWETRQRPDMPRHRPSIVRLVIHGVRDMNAFCGWLSRGHSRLSTLILETVVDYDLSSLAALDALRHLVLHRPFALAAVTALAAAGARLRTLRLLEADELNFAQPVDLPFRSDGALSRATVAELLPLCGALESLVLHSNTRVPPRSISALAAAKPSALVSLVVIERLGAGVANFECLSSLPSLTRLSHHATNAAARPVAWPTLPRVTSLDLGESFVADCDSLPRHFPHLVALRVAVDHPSFLTGFPELASLAVVDMNRCTRVDKIPWRQYLRIDELADALSRMPKLARLSVHCYRDAAIGEGRTWHLPHLVELTLCMPSTHIPPIVAPRLRILRGNVLSCETIDRVLSDSPALERIDCSQVRGLTPFAPTGYISLVAPCASPTTPFASPTTPGTRRVRVERHAPIAGLQSAYSRQFHESSSHEPSEWL